MKPRFYGRRGSTYNLTGAPLPPRIGNGIDPVSGRSLPPGYAETGGRHPSSEDHDWSGFNNAFHRQRALARDVQRRIATSEQAQEDFTHPFGESKKESAIDRMVDRVAPEPRLPDFGDTGGGGMMRQNPGAELSASASKPSGRERTGTQAAAPMITNQDGSKAVLTPSGFQSVVQSESGPRNVAVTPTGTQALQNRFDGTANKMFGRGWSDLSPDERRSVLQASPAAADVGAVVDNGQRTVVRPGHADTWNETPTGLVDNSRMTPEQMHDMERQYAPKDASGTPAPVVGRYTPGAQTQVQDTDVAKSSAPFNSQALAPNASGTNLSTSIPTGGLATRSASTATSTAQPAQITTTEQGGDQPAPQPTTTAGQTGAAFRDSLVRAPSIARNAVDDTTKSLGNATYLPVRNFVAGMFGAPEADPWKLSGNPSPSASPAPLPSAPIQTDDASGLRVAGSQMTMSGSHPGTVASAGPAIHPYGDSKLSMAFGSADLPKVQLNPSQPKQPDISSMPKVPDFGDTGGGGMMRQKTDDDDELTKGLKAWPSPNNAAFPTTALSDQGTTRLDKQTQGWD